MRNELAKWLIGVGAVIALVGLVLLVLERLGVGRLPGDLVLRGKSLVVHFPLATSLFISLLLTILLNIWIRWR